MKIVLLAIIYGLNMQQAAAASSSYSMINSHSEYVVAGSSDEPTYYQLPSEVELTPAELQAMKRILLRALSQYNKKYEREDFRIGPLADYGVQYKVFVTKDKGKKIWINGFCKDTFFIRDATTLTTLPVSVLDGGSCHFNTTIDLAKRKASRVVIHGFA